MNLGEWTKAIFEKCRFGPLMIVSMGVSFTAGKGQDREIQYMYCPKAGASFSGRFNNRSEAYDWAHSLKDLENPMEIMAKSYLYNDFGEFFRESGWTARSPVAIHLWIQK